jgi:DivIVA domain-containing protein
VTWLFILLAMAVIALVAGVVTGRITGAMELPASSLPFRGLPPEDVVAADLEELRFDAALRGYRMNEVDEVIDRLAVELQQRDDEIAELRAALADLRLDGVASDQFAPTASVPSWPEEQDDDAGYHAAYVPPAGDDEPRAWPGPDQG